MSKIQPAGPGEILRAVQKDESYLNRIQQDVSSLGLDLFGPQIWIKYKSLSEPTVRFLYYAITTLSDFQTLGEEYTGLIQVTSRNRIPSKVTRLVMIFLQTFGPYVIKFWAKNLRNTLEQNPWKCDQVIVNKIKDLLPLMEDVASFVDKINVCIFYFHGVFYHLAKRLTGVRYVKYNLGESKPDNTRGGFRVLGIAATVHLALNIIYTFYKHRNNLSRVKPENNNRSEEVVQASYVPPRERCSLCLDRLGSRGITTATPCGHLYCWTCIMESLHRNPECPLCRQPVDKSRVVPCRNYC